MIPNKYKFFIKYIFIVYMFDVTNLWNFFYYNGGSSNIVLFFFSKTQNICASFFLVKYRTVTIFLYVVLSNITVLNHHIFFKKNIVSQHISHILSMYFLQLKI
jgi:hypothetical protein